MIALAERPHANLERAPQREIDMSRCWGSFGQILLFHDIQKPDGTTIRKGVGISIAYPPGVSPDMGQEILTRAFGFENPRTQEWDGVEEGKIICLTQESPDNTVDLTPIRRFIEASTQVIEEKHPLARHNRVQEFLANSKKRLDFAEVIEQDVRRILKTPGFTGWSAFNPKCEGMGRAYVVEFILDEDGIAYGSRPDGTKGSLLEIATDESHAFWLKDGLVAMMKNPNIHKGGDFEDTESVSKCGGLEDQEESGCSTFFSIMEGRSETLHITTLYDLVDDYQRVFVSPILQASETSICTQCGASKEECRGHE